ncbi:MAG: response regulator [Gemmatimonadota bacterium]
MLLVDDDDGVREFLATVLTRKGHAVDAVPTCLDALFHFIRIPYDCLILDLCLPEGNGLHVYHQARRIDPYLAERVVFITGYDESHPLYQQARELSLPVLSKPLSIPRLIEILNGYS